MQGAEELNRAVKSIKDISPLLSQMRQFLNFLDSVFEEPNFKLNLLILEVYGILIEKLRSKVKSHVRMFCVSLLRHASHSKIVVRIENYRVIKKLMVQAKPNNVINHFFEHLGDKRSTVREDILNVVMFALLTFPSYEFDLKNIAATVVPTLVDPKRRVRQASQECVAVLAAFMGPSKAAPLIRLDFLRYIPNPLTYYHDARLRVIFLLTCDMAGIRTHVSRIVPPWYLLQEALPTEQSHRSLK